MNLKYGAIASLLCVQSALAVSRVIFYTGTGCSGDGHSRAPDACTTGMPGVLYSSVRATVDRGYTYDLAAYSSQNGQMCAIPLGETSRGCLSSNIEQSLTGATLVLYAPCGRPSICLTDARSPIPEMDDGLGDLHVYTNRTTNVSHYVKMSEKTDSLLNGLSEDEKSKYIVENADYVELPGGKIEPTNRLQNESK